MYIKESGLTQALGIVDQANKFIAERAGFADQVMREKAKSDLFYAEAEFNKNTQDFLRDLSTKNDYPNFGKYLDNYLTEQNQALQKKAKNHYTGELFNQMITSQRNALENTVQNQALALQIKDITTQNQGAIQLNRNNLSGQNGINANNPIFNYEFAKGMRDSNYTRAALLDDGTKNIEKELLTDCESLMQKLYVNGGDFSQVEKYIDDTLRDNEYQIMMLDDKYASEEGLKYAEEHPDECYMNIGNEVDKKSIGDNMKKTLKARWKTEIDEMHEKNFGKITEMLVEFEKLSPTEKLNYANYALSKIETDYSGNRLSPSQRAQAVNFFTVGKSAASGSSASSKLKKEYEDFIEITQDGYIQLYLDGTLDGYTARKAFEDKCLPEYERLFGKKGTFNMKMDFPVISGFLDALQKKAPEQLKGLITDVENIIEKSAKDAKLDNPKEYAAMAVDLTWDTLMELKLSDPKSIEEASKKIRAKANSWYGKELDLVRKNPKTGNSDLEVGVFNNLESTAAKYLYEIENHDEFRYIDKNGIEKTSIFGSDETFEVADKMQREILKKNLGVDPGNLKRNFEIKTKVNGLGMIEADPRDVSSNMVYTDATTGTQYKVRSADGKDIDLYKKDNGEKWEKVNTIKQQDAVDKKDHAAEVYKQMEEFAEKVSVSYMDPPPGVPSNTWISYIGKDGKDKKAIAKKLQELMLNAEENKDPRVKARLEAWLNKNGF